MYKKNNKPYPQSLRDACVVSVQTNKLIQTNAPKMWVAYYCHLPFGGHKTSENYVLDGFRCEKIGNNPDIIFYRAGLLPTAYV